MKNTNDTLLTKNKTEITGNRKHVLNSMTPLQQDIITCIIAENEEQEPPRNNAAHIMNAFAGGFSLGMPFTLFMPAANKVILYVAEEGANESADKRSVFNKRCEALKKPLVDAADFIINLVHQNCLRLMEKHSDAELPEDYGTHWRRYEAFYTPEIESLAFVCSNLFVPKFRLYELANTHEETPRHLIMPGKLRLRIASR
jgi:hypothetical protein